VCVSEVHLCVDLWDSAVCACVLGNSVTEDALSESVCRVPEGGCVCVCVHRRCDMGEV
jgi:hypothetical protein